MIAWLRCLWKGHDWEYRYDTTAGLEEWEACRCCGKERDVRR